LLKTRGLCIVIFIIAKIVTSLCVARNSEKLSIDFLPCFSFAAEHLRNYIGLEVIMYKAGKSVVNRNARNVQLTTNMKREETLGAYVQLFACMMHASVAYFMLQVSYSIIRALACLLYFED